MNTKDVIFELRTKAGLSQDELAEKVFVTRQAVSRWENGETVPNTETLKRLSELFHVSINTLLGSPQKLICQCCGMPLEDGIIGRNKDGSLNEDYCKWCYADGTYTYRRQLWINTRYCKTSPLKRTKKVFSPEHGCLPRTVKSSQKALWAG